MFSKAATGVLSDQVFVWSHWHYLMLKGNSTFEMMCFSWCYCVFGQQLCCSGLHDRINSMVKCLLFIASVLQLKFDDMKKVLFWELPSLWLCLYLSLSPLIVYVPPFRLSLSLPLLSLCLFLPPTSLSLPLCLSVCSSFLSLSLPPLHPPLVSVSSWWPCSLYSRWGL